MTDPETAHAEKTFPQAFSLEGRIAFVSGAAGHLGSAIAIGLAEAGAHVVLNGRDPTKLERLQTSLADHGHSSSVLEGDVANDADRTRAIEHIGERFGRLHVLVNNAYHGRTGTIETATLEDFAAAFSIAVTSAFRLVQLARPLLQRGSTESPGGAAVVNVGSMYGLVSPDPRIYGTSGSNNPPHYGAAKAALVQLTRYLACHLAADRIRVNSVSPGPFPPADIEQKNPDFHAALCDKSPMHRIGHPREVAGPVLFLVSDAASYVTGADLRVDGGWTAW